ncbi:uncharacterized protein METZ01_LOCUS430809, partial [marine metagenome]
VKSIEVSKTVSYISITFNLLPIYFNKIESFGLENTPERTAHLFAVCKTKKH